MRKPIAVLIVDDSEKDSLSLVEALRRAGFDPTWKRVDDAPSLRAALDERGWDVVLSDCRLSRLEDPELLRHLQDEASERPFLLVSRTADEDAMLAFLRAGAAGFLPKSALERLPVVVGRALEEAESRRRAREVELRYRSLMENVEEVVYAGDFDSGSADGTLHRRLTFVSPRAEQVLGFAPNEFLNDNKLWIRRVLEEDHETIAETVSRAVAERHGATCVYRFRTKAGEVRWIEANFVPRFDGPGPPVRFFGTARDVTERRRNEETFRIARAALDHSGDMIFWVDASGRIVYANDRTMKNLGYSREELLRMSVWDLSRDIRARDWPEAWAAPGQRGWRTHDDGVRRKDGSTFEVEVGVTYVRQDEKELHCVILRDMTARRKAEEALRTSESRYRALVESLPDLVFVLSPEGIFVDYHASDSESLITPAEDFLGRPMKDVLPHEVLEKVEPAFADVVSHGGFRIAEYALDFATGKRYFDSRMTRMEDGRVLSVVRDVTRIKEAEGRLREILEHSTNMFYTHAPDGRLTYASPQSRHFLGCEPEEAMVGWTEFLTDNVENQAGMELTVKAIETGIAQGPYELELQTRDGRRLWVEVNEAPIVVDGRTVSVVGSLTDVTGRKRAEAERAQAEQAMRLAQRMESIGRLAGGVAHDFNNLLSVILGYTSFAMEDLSPGASIYDDLQEIRKAGERATDLTRQLLAFSRRQVMRPTVLDLNLVVADTEKMLRRVLGEDIELVTDLADGLCEVKADRGQIEQILMNLAVNGRDAMPEGGKLAVGTANVEIDASFAQAHPPMTPGPYVRLTIGDTGTGMAQEVLQRVFEPFFTTKELGKGTGLGLSTVYGIVKQSDGFIWAESEPGKGTAFHIYLPPCEKEQSTSVPRGQDGDGTHGSETVLVVEDERAVRQLAERILKRSGYDVIATEVAGEALERCEQDGKAIHLLLTDVVMPGTNGRELAQRITELRPGIKVLFMSGYSEDMIAHHGVLEPGVHLITKPFDPDELRKKVREVLDEREPSPTR